MSKNVSDAEYLKILDEAYEEAWEVANSEDGWKEEHKGSFLSYGQRNKINFHVANCLHVSLRVFYLLFTVSLSTSLCVFYFIRSIFF